MNVDQRRRGRHHDGQRHQGGHHAVGPVKEVAQSHRHRDHGAQGENDGGQRAPGAIDDEHQRHQEYPEERHELLGRCAGLSFQPGIEPRRTDTPDGGEGVPRDIERQHQRVDRRQRAVPFGGRLDFEVERNGHVVLTQEPGPPEQRGAGGEGSQALGIVRADRGRGTRSKVDRQQAMGHNPRDLVELVLQSIGTLQRGRAQRILGVEDDERLFAFRKHALEFERSLCRRVAGHDQPIDGRVGRYPRGAVDSGCGQEQEHADDGIPPLQHAAEQPQQCGRGEHSHKSTRLCRSGGPLGRGNDSLCP